MKIIVEIKIRDKQRWQLLFFNDMSDKKKENILSEITNRECLELSIISLVLFVILVGDITHRWFFANYQWLQLDTTYN